MSSIIVARTSLGNVNIDILKKVLEVLGLEGLEIRDHIKDYYHASHTSWGGNKIIGAIFTKDLARGVGVSVDKQGHLIFVSHESGAAFEEIKSKVEKTYKLIEFITEIQQMGYGVSILQDAEKRTVLEGNLFPQKITLTLDDKGNATFDLDGFSGKACLEEIKTLIEALKEKGVNVDVKDTRLKPESQIEAPPKQTERRRQREG